MKKLTLALALALAVTRPVQLVEKGRPSNAQQTCGPLAGVSGCGGTGDV
jgi:hypothetical protein